SCQFVVPREGTAHLPARNAWAAPDREAARATVVGARRCRARRSDRRLAGAIPARCPARRAGADLPRARLGRREGPPLASLVEPGRLARRRDARTRCGGLPE